MAQTAGAPPETTAGSLVDSAKTNAAAAYDTVMNGPVSQSVQNHGAKISSEFADLAASRETPVNSAVTGQPLTHYHSFFSELLSWQNPRASAITYASIVSLIVGARYLDVMRYALKFSWMSLALTVTIEVAGRLTLNRGLTTQMRPRRYFTVSRVTVENMLGDAHELINFFAIEAQRLFYVENVAASTAAFFAALIAYYLIKLVPYWGLAVIATTVTFFVPLIYTVNQEFVDELVKSASELINDQTAQIRSVAQEQADQIAAFSKQYAGDYTDKVQGMLRVRSTTPPTASAPISAPVRSAPESGEPFPSPPTEEPRKPVAAKADILKPTDPAEALVDPVEAS